MVRGPTCPLFPPDCADEEQWNQPKEEHLGELHPG